MSESLPSSLPPTPAESEKVTPTKKGRELSIGSPVMYASEPRTITNITSSGSDRLIFVSPKESFLASPDEDVEVPA